MYRFTSTVIISALALTQVACAGPALDRPQVVVHFADLVLWLRGKETVDTSNIIYPSRAAFSRQGEMFGGVLTTV